MAASKKPMKQSKVEILLFIGFRKEQVLLPHKGRFQFVKGGIIMTLYIFTPTTVSDFGQKKKIIKK